MELKIDINSDTCIKCGKCEKVCPASLFSYNRKNKGYEVHDKDKCIVCGHCAAVCPEGAVIHSEFPEETVHPINSKSLPAHEQVMSLIKSRRSNRAFSKEPIPAGYIDLILEAAHRAPTASNLQQVHFTVVSDPEMLRTIGQYTIDIFTSIKDKMTNPVVKPVVKKFMPNAYGMIPRFEALKESFDNGADPILRNATTVIFIHSPKTNLFGCEDCNLAYQNGSLMAESLGVSQVYTGFVLQAVKRDKKDLFAKLLGTNDNIHAGMAIGMPQFQYPNYIDKKDAIINWL